MAVTVQSFVRERPEFATAGPALIQATLALAASRVDAGAWGSAYDQAHSLMTAHLLWESPFGTSMRLDGGGEATKSRYLEELKSLSLERIPRIMVLR